MDVGYVDHLLTSARREGGRTTSCGKGSVEHAAVAINTLGTGQCEVLIEGIRERLAIQALDRAYQTTGEAVIVPERDLMILREAEVRIDRSNVGAGGRRRSRTRCAAGWRERRARCRRGCGVWRGGRRGESGRRPFCPVSCATPPRERA